MGGTCGVVWMHVWCLSKAQKDSRVSCSCPQCKLNTACFLQAQAPSVQPVYVWDLQRRTWLMLELCWLCWLSCHFPPTQPWLPQWGLSTDHQTTLALKKMYNISDQQDWSQKCSAWKYVYCWYGQMSPGNMSWWQL